ncbi:hypothetical protein [Cytophaga hutchinsonii]|uniref:TIR domain-containing protein n=1 Tax=Cytophaga hutchinsonii (strain ATCC 33406 / DSM 1761 / CIP 103989 / NBRC 15051 / NCIMB 9469 / D465) TaxID=269798 RepID=A0A6N4SPS9_CYTH3|nr:hypothetical protein [Cytophaga hutchinsonii]ABG58300.1 hypothetical protein CHU_1023 [Cytophaga hutchinsonii ATCC 33406]SFX53028.1 hypothetical protein SAMN04487930_105129 [Cytophaga hutchinsonii ATCC 33406]
MAFEYDIFLSYTSTDNEKLPGYDAGWVDNFKKFLDTLISQLLQHHPKIITSQEITEPGFNPFEKACVVIYLVSPEYIVSGEFIKEAEYLQLLMSNSNNMRIDGKLRMFKAAKSFVEPEKYHPLLRELVSYDLFMYDPFTGLMKEFNAFFGQDAEKTYWMRLVDLAYDIYKVIYYNQSQAINADFKQKATESMPDECIYLAETGNDLLIQKNIIRRELERHGYHVLPDKVLSPHAVDTNVTIKSDLDKCKLSIHLIGESFISEEFENREEVELMKLQNQIAVEYSNTKKNSIPFRRLIWIPQELSFADDKQQLLMESFISNTESMNGAEVLKIPIEEFKSLIKRELATIKDDKGYGYFIPEAALSSDSGKNIYVIVDAIDISKCQPVVNHLKQNGFDVLLPMFEGDIMEVRASHRNNLNACDSCLIFSDQVSEQWVKSKVLDILKAPGFGRKKNMIGKAIYLSTDKLIDSEYYKKYNFSIIRSNAGNFEKEIIQPFLKQITV